MHRRQTKSFGSARIKPHRKPLRHCCSKLQQFIRHCGISTIPETRRRLPSERICKNDALLEAGRKQQGSKPPGITEPTNKLRKTKKPQETNPPQPSRYPTLHPSSPFHQPPEKRTSTKFYKQNGGSMAFPSSGCLPVLAGLCDPPNGLGQQQIHDPALTGPSKEYAESTSTNDWSLKNDDSLLVRFQIPKNRFSRELFPET